MRPSAACLVAALTASCSLAFMNKPHEPVTVPYYPVECTTSRAAPILDVIGTAYFVANGLYLLSREECTAFGSTSCVESGTKVGGALLSAALAITYAASSGVGFTSAAHCDAIKDLNVLCMSGDRSACNKLNPSWVPPPAGQPWPVAPAPQMSSGCSKDSDCKGERICVQAICVEPTPRVPPVPPVQQTPRDSCQRDSDCDYGICYEGRCGR